MKDRFYPVIDNEKVKELKISVKKSFYFKTDDEKHYFQIKPVNEFDGDKTLDYMLEDEDYEWDVKKQEVFLNLEIKISNPNCLFGDTGVAYDDSILGFGLEWKANNSKIKNCLKIGEILNSGKEIYFKKEDIRINDLNSNIDFNWVIYVIKSGNKKNTAFFGNEKGLILGDGLFWRIITDGESSIFPIQEEDNLKGPLWRCESNITDIFEDDFTIENVTIFINRKHPSYTYISPKSENYNKAFFIEVISSALTMLILDIRNGEKLQVSNAESKGSIAMALNYFYSLGIDINGSNSDLLKSIKTFFDERY